MKEYPNWVKMPHDLMTNIFQRLPTLEILSARKVCKTWQRICKDPGKWKVIDIKKPANIGYNIEMLTKQAVDLSCGELIDISIQGFGSDNLLNYILLSSSKLKHLSLMNCISMTKSGFSRAIERFSQLEKLCVSLVFINAKDIQVIGRNCPQLKSFTRNKQFVWKRNDTDAFAIANYMPELRHLQLVGSQMTNNGLHAILKGCPHLESLDVRKCFNLYLGGNLRKMCAERIKDFLRPDDTTENETYVSTFWYSDSDFDDFSEGDTSEEDDNA